MAARTWGTLSPRAQQRVLEIAPGALTWLVLLLPLVVAFTIRLNNPADLWILAAGALVLDVYWLGRTPGPVGAVRRSLHELQATQEIDWWERCRSLDLPEGSARPE